jgi:perosamine synthetase
MKISKNKYLFNNLGYEEKKNILKILNSGFLSGFAASPNESFFGGQWVKKLEGNFRKFFNVKYAVAVNSATSGIYCALMAHDIEPGDEVITTPYTMQATSSSILQCLGVPIFADIEKDTYGLDPKSVEKKINARTKGILVVNLFGHPANLLELKKIAKKYGLWLIEDNSQSPAAKLENNKFSGTVGTAGIFSFNQHKPIHCGEGGVVITNSRKIYMKMCLVRNHGETVVESFKIKNINNTIGQNFRLTEMQAAIALTQFQKISKINSQRVKLSNRITKRILSLKIRGITPPIVRKKCKHVYYFYVMKYDEKVTGIKIKTFVKAMTAQGFYLRQGYLKPLYLEPIFQKKICFGKKGIPFTLNSNNKNISYKKGICPNCENIQKSVILTNIISPPYNLKYMDSFVDTMQKILKKK